MRNGNFVNGKMEKEEIRALNFGVKGIQRTGDLSSQKYSKYNKSAKTVKTKRKIKSALKRALLKNYGFRIEDN